MLRLPPISTRTSTLFPDTTLLRSKQRLRNPDYQTLGRLLRRMKDAASTRNRLIHGTWRLDLVMGDKPLQAERVEWVRFYCPTRSEEHKSELQSLMRISYAVLCLKKKIKRHKNHQDIVNVAHL